MARLFISYSRADKLFIEQLVPLLKKVFPHHEIWWDDDLTGGEDWWERILSEIGDCDLFMYLLSNDSLTSEYCQNEFREALRLRKLCVPVIIRPKTDMKNAPADLSSELSRRNWVDMSGGFKDSDANAGLFRAINVQIGKIPTQSPTPLSPTPIPQSNVAATSKGLDWTKIGDITAVIVGLLGVGAAIAQPFIAAALQGQSMATTPTASATAIPMVTPFPTTTSIPTLGVAHILTVTPIPAATVALVPPNSPTGVLPAVIYTFSSVPTEMLLLARPTITLDKSIATAPMQSSDLLSSPTLESNDKTVYIIRDADSLTVFSPSQGAISLLGLKFEVQEQSNSNIYFIEQYIGFVGLPFNKLMTPICLRLVRRSSNSVMTNRCQGLTPNQRFSSIVMDADVFWYDLEASQGKILNILFGLTKVGTCPGQQSQCSFVALPDKTK